MNITDELREWWVRKFPIMDKELHKDFTAIADRIDAAHEESIQREHENAYDVGYAEGMGVANKADMRAEYLRGKNDGYDEGWDVGFASADDWLGQHEDAMAEHGWVRLPKDADGEYIHVWDRLDGYGKTIEVVELRHGRSGWVLISRDGNGYADTFAFTHHAPTVEDVLREFTDAILEWSGKSGTVAEVGTWSDIAADYADKLRLAEGEDA